MRFPYSLAVVRSIDTGEEIVLLRPEVPIHLYGPAGTVEVVALVDTGADNSIFPLSIARDLGIETTEGKGPAATAFGGQQIALSFADVVLELSQAGVTIRWQGRLHFADFPGDTEKAVILGHEGFLDYFTATFDGAECSLELEPNDSIPVV
ncbi:MAG: aspartyl protease family protein [Thermoguttaceae bacterium]